MQITLRDWVGVWKGRHTRDGIDTTCQDSMRQERNYSLQNGKNEISPFGSAQQIYPQGIESKLWCQVTSVFQWSNVTRLAWNRRRLSLCCSLYPQEAQYISRQKKKRFKILSRGKCYHVVIQNQSIAWHVLVEIFGFSKIIHKTCFFQLPHLF